MNVKDLLENEELMNSIIEDLEDFPEETEVRYEVWAIGYLADDTISDVDLLIGEFSDPDEALTCAEKVTLEEILNGITKYNPELSCFSVEIETILTDPDDEDCDTTNVGTIYHREIQI